MSSNQKTPSLYGSRSVAHGLRDDAFAHIDQSTRKKLIKLMARISEKSYRRGFQHGQEFAKKGDKAVDGHYLRFHVPIDKSPYTDTFHTNGKWAPNSGFSAIERLLMEYGELRTLLILE